MLDSSLPGAVAVDATLFTITCTTCQARLKVRDPAIVGDIVACPKCESMVLVEPPPGWKPPAATASDAAEEKAVSVTTESGEHRAVAATLAPSALVVAPAAPAAPPADRPKAGGRPAPPTVRPPTPPAADASTLAAPAAADNAPPVAAPAALPPVVARPAVTPPPPPNLRGGDAEMEELPPDRPGVFGWLSRHALIVGGIGLWLAAVGIGLVALSASRRGTSPGPPPVQPAEAAAEALEPPTAKAPETPAPPALKPEPLVGPLDPQWIPSQTRMLVRLRVSHLAALPEFERLVQRGAALWRPTLGTLLEGFGVQPAVVRRVSWAITDLTRCGPTSLVVVELEPNQDATRLTATARPLSWKVRGFDCFQRADTAWPLPFAVLDAHTLITGPEPLLREVGDRESPALDSKPLERLLAVAGSDAALACHLDFTAARAAGWRLPDWWMDIWPAGQNAWRGAWENAEGAALCLEADKTLHSSVYLACAGGGQTHKVRHSVDEILPLAQHVVAARAETAAAHTGDAEEARYVPLLKAAAAALKSAQSTVAGETVRVRLDWSGPLSPLAQAALDGEPGARRDWYAAALQADEARWKRLQPGLDAYRQGQGHFPAAAAGGGLLSPQTRLSWIATLLPYFGYAQWHQQLEFGNAWNSPQNVRIARRPFEAVINPTLGPACDAAGFPVTHYVGVAGVGADAGALPADHPRAGVFGYGRTTRCEDITDGLANTIAFLGASGRTGAWASGGEPSVRPLTHAPYVNGPDGFGSGQPDGMLAGMADGAVRFLSKDVDPRVIEQLATIHGGETVDLAVLDRRPPPRPISPPEAVAAPARPAANPSPSAPLLPGGDLLDSEHLAPVARLPAPQIPGPNVQKLLETKIPEIEMNGSLSEVVDALTAVSGMPVAFDPDALLRLNVSADVPVSVRLKDAAVQMVLEMAAVQAGLAFSTEGNAARITSTKEDRQTLKPARYAVGDLTGRDATAAARLAGWVRQFVAPESWHEAGGPGTIVAEPDALKIEQTEVVHDQVNAFCQRLRAARKGTPQGPLEAQRFPLATRAQRAAGLLTRPVTANFAEPAPLGRELKFLGAAAECKILVDWNALRSLQVGPQSLAVCKISEQPLGPALGGVLRPLNLAFHVLDAQLLEVTTPQHIAARMELEFYPVADLVSKGVSGMELADRLRSTVAKGTWRDTGKTAAADFDPPSGYLLVLHNQPTQQRVAHWLDELRAEKAAPVVKLP